MVFVWNWKRKTWGFVLIRQLPRKSFLWPAGQIQRSSEHLQTPNKNCIEILGWLPIRKRNFEMPIFANLTRLWKLFWDAVVTPFIQAFSHLPLIERLWKLMISICANESAYFCNPFPHMVVTKNYKKALEKITYALREAPHMLAVRSSKSYAK